MGFRSGFIRTLLMGAVVVMMGCSSVGAQVATPYRQYRPQSRVSLQLYFGQGYYYPQYYRSHRHVVIHRHVVPERGVVYRNRDSARRPDPQRSRSMNQRPERRPERQRPQRQNRRQRNGN